MANHLVLWIAFSVLACNDIRLVQTADECKTHDDCKENFFYKFCCGGGSSTAVSKAKERTCKIGSCLYRYCSTDSDCGDPSMCCRSNKCVNEGCSGCTTDTDCYSSHHCCKKTFPFYQTICAESCVDESCNWNDDCAGRFECCRSRKCTTTGCNDHCSSNSECDLGQYCCKEKNGIIEDGCSENCVGENCLSNNDCGGLGECCRSGKCTTTGCNDHCSSNSECSSSQYCCKKKDGVSKDSCSDNCVGEYCVSNDDCGGPGEFCDHNTCTTTSYMPKNSSNSPPPWLIAVIAVSIVVFLGIFVAVIWHCNRMRRTNATQVNQGTVRLQNTHTPEAVIQSPQPNNQFHGFNNPTQYQGKGLQNQPQQTLSPLDPLKMIPHPGNENPGYLNLSQNPYHQGNQTPASFNPNQHDNNGYVIPGPPHIPTYENPHTTGTQFSNSDPQFYPQNALENPPYNPHYPDNHP